MKRELPTGVYKAHSDHYYVLKNVKGRLTYLGSYLTPEEASEAFQTGTKLPTATNRGTRKKKATES